MLTSDLNNADTSSLENPLAKAPSIVEWVKTIELGYDEPNPLPTICFSCGKKEQQQQQQIETETETKSQDSNEDNNNNSPTTEDDNSDNNQKNDKDEANQQQTTSTEAATTTETVTKLSKCSKCNIASYCGRECQINDWKKGGHKNACPSYHRLFQLKKLIAQATEAAAEAEATTTTTDTTAITTEISTIKETIRNEIYHRIRFYACPYAVYKTCELGKGFLFLQSDTTLQDLSLTIPKDCTGRLLSIPPRAILLHYLTLGEYDAEVCKDDFEMALVRDSLQQLVSTYHSKQEVVILIRFRCGHVSVGKAALVPDYRICKQLGKDYYENTTSSSSGGAVQLNLDDL